MACLLSVSLFNIFQNGPIILQSIEYALQLMIEYLTNFQFYIREKRINYFHSKLKDDNHQCRPHSYRSRIINRNPLIIYIENFLTKNEINRLIELV